MPFNVKRYLYVVDTGQSGSGWVSDYQPAEAFTLSPPSAVRTELLSGGKSLRVTWKLSPTAQGSGLVAKHFVYLPQLGGKPDFLPRLPITKVGGDATLLPVAESGGKEVSVTLDLPEPLPVAPDVRVTSAVQVGVDAAGKPVYLESDKSDVQAQGMITGVVNLQKDEVDPEKLNAANHFETLAGFPVPGAKVVCTFTVDRQPRTLYLTANKDGNFTAMVPLNVVVKVTARGETKTVTCTPAKPRAGLAFGWQGHEVKVDKEVSTEVVPLNVPPPPL